MPLQHKENISLDSISSIFEKVLPAESLELVEKGINSLLPLSSGSLKKILEKHATGGKRVRPAMMLLAAGMTGCGGEALIRAASCVEVIHTASLLHDDIIDDACTRRGIASANAEFGSSRAVLAGDYLYTKAFMSILSLDPGYRPLELLKELTGAVVKMSESEIMQLDAAGSTNIDIERYYKIVEGKTAALFSALCRCVALMAGLTDGKADMLERYGHYAGLAFQLRDDVMDYFSDEKHTGKKTGADLEGKKMTLPLFLLAEYIPLAEVQKILLSLSPVDHKMEILSRYFEEFNIKERSAEAVNSFTDKALEALGAFSENKYKTALIEFTNLLRQ